MAVLEKEIMLDLADYAVNSALQKGASEVEAYLYEGHSTNIGIERGQVTKSNKIVDQGLGIRVVVKKALGFAYTNDIEIDDDGTIWVATSIYGIYEITPTDTINYTDVNSNIPTKVINSVTKSMDGNKWFTHVSYLSQRGGVSRYNDAGFEPFYIGSISIVPRSIYIDNSDNKWVSSNEGIFVLNQANTEIRINRSNSLISSINIHDIDMDGNGVVWIATYGGLNKYKIDNQ